MKSCKKLFQITLFLIAIIINTPFLLAQKLATTKELAIKKIVENQTYIFYATSVSPLSGRQQYLTSTYTFEVGKDTLVSYLPYFGKAYALTIGATDGGIKFTSTKFDYNINLRKKGGWDINIKTKDVSDVQTLMLRIYTNGTSYLNINSTNRQPISYTSFIGERKSK